MRKILILILSLVPSCLVAQFYSEFQVKNAAYVNTTVLHYEKGDSMIIINNNNSIPITSYVLENQTDSIYVHPILPSGWSYIVLYKQHATTYNIKIGDFFRVVLDNNGNSYLRLH